jgi:hypothetical protein
MSGADDPTEAAPLPAERDEVPLSQIVFDNIWLWFMLGIAVPFVFYLVWGLLDIASTPVAPPGT